jgi:hypothetical protein
MVGYLELVMCLRERRRYERGIPTPELDELEPNAIGRVIA